MKQFLKKALKIYLLGFLIVVTAVIIWGMSKDDSPERMAKKVNEVPQYYMPDDLDIYEDKNIYKVLTNGLLYKLKKDNTTLLAIDKTRSLALLKEDTILFFDNAIGRLQEHPYIWVTTANKKHSGWIHVKNLGYNQK